MAQQPRYLSTDPNAGLEPEAQTYLSTDPNAGMEPEESLPERLGLYETAGGLVGGAAGSLLGPAGTIPGAMLGAGAVRVIRGLRRREDPASIATGALGTAALEALPVVGKAVKAIGRAGVTSALPIAETTAKALGKRGSILKPSMASKITEAAPVSRGQEEIIQRTLDAPGIRLQKVVNKGGEKIAALGARRQRIVQGIEDYIDPRPILERAETLVSRSGAVGKNMAASNTAARKAFRKFEDHVLGDEGVRTLPAAELDDILRGTKFERGGHALPGAKAGAAELRTGMSQTLKAADPTGELARVMADQERMQFLQPVWDKALAAAKGTRKVAQPEVLVSGATPRAFFMIPSPRRTAFAAGKGLYRIGGGLQSPLIPGAARGVPEGLDQLYELLVEQELRKRSVAGGP